jgi:hypothetical protein
MMERQATGRRGAWLWGAVALLGAGCGGKTNEPSCDDDTCQVSTCANGVADGTETDVDCGGACPECQPGRVCSLNRDCSSLDCRDQRCVRAPACTDGLENGDETDVDCGGSACTGCADGQACLVDRDCGDYELGSRCLDEVCEAASCTDAVLNGSETDVDCGGRACAPCHVGAQCDVAMDCADQICALFDGSRTQTTCIAAHCSNGKIDADETDLDCGGSECVSCPGGSGCDLHRDCELDSNLVCVAGVCRLPCRVSEDCGGTGQCSADACVYCEGEGDCDFPCGASLSCVCKNGYSTCG